MRRMKKLTALMLAVLLMMQLLPVSAAAENPEEIISDVYSAPVYHTVSFTAEGEEIASLFVNNGAAISRLPDAPEVEGKTFTGWFIGETAVTAETAVTQDLTVTAVYTETEAPAPENGALAEGKDYYLTGSLPDGIVEVTPATVTIAGAEVLAACDVRVSAARKLLSKSSSGEPEDGKMQLHFHNEAFSSEIVDIYRMADAEAEPEYIGTMQAEDGWVAFEADASYIYAVVRTKLTKTVTTSDGATYEIEVTYKNTAGIPMEGTDLLVSEIREGDAGYDAYISASADKLGINPENIEISRAFDISIVDEADHSIVYEPSGEVEVSITLVGASLYEYANVDVLHFVGDVNTKNLVAYEMNSTVNGETVSFTTDSFSVYVIDGVVPLRTYRFYSFDEYGDYIDYYFNTDSGETTSTQTIKNGETPVVPGNPTNPQDPTATFAGWYQGDGSMDPQFDEGSTAYDFDNIPVITETEVVHLYARFLSYAYVIFHDQYDAETSSFPVAYTVRAELMNGSAEVDISGKKVVYNGGKTKVFYGWSATENAGPDEKLDSPVTVTDTMHLYPIFKPVYWLSFNSGPTGSGATYYPETYYFDGIGPETLSDHIPTRDGAYTFEGWFTGADGTGTKIAEADGSLIAGASTEGISVTDGQIVLTADVMLYAAWTADTKADYTVIIEKQKASDNTGLPDAQKTYEYAESFVLSGTIGQSVSAGTDYTGMDEDANYNSLHPGASVSGEENPYCGYTYNAANSTAGVTVAADGSAVLYVRYDWTSKPEMSGKTFTLTFADSVTDGASSSLPVTKTEIAYNTPLADDDDVPADPVSGREGYSFLGWFADQACTTRVFFEQTKYNAYTGSKVLLETMPGTDLTVYAGWEESWYVVTVDPNYGAMYAYNGSTLEGTGSTWFWSAYGSKIQEYTTVTRDYVESDSGTYYYVNHAGDGLGGDNGWPDRYTYYTTNPSEATEFTTFKQEPGIYRYEGWYEVKSDGSEEPYDFSKIVDHYITIKLHWSKVGAFYLQYVAGEGTLNGEEELEEVYVALDGGGYADNAEVVVTRTATAPEGYEFVGWTIRGDDSGTVYRPGQTFTLLTSYAATVQGRQTVYLEAVYTKIPTATIVYHANGGTIEPNNLDYGSLADPVEPDDQSKAKPLSGNYDITEEDNTATVTGLANNSKVYLSGSGFIRDDAEFAGWCSNRVYDPDDESAPLFVPNTLYGVDVNEPADLYAVWQVSVNYLLNNEDPGANFGDNWGADYTLSGDTYTQNGYLGSTVKYPPYDPLCTGQEFLYWATRTGTDDSYTYTQYDFSQPVTGELDLYALWGESAEVPIHAVLASDGMFEDKDVWLKKTAVSVGETGITPDASAAADYVSPTGGAYEFAYAAVNNSLSGVQEKQVQKLYYNSDDSKVYVIDSNGNETALADGEGLYFVYNNARESFTAEVHVALVDVSSGSISNQDSWRGSTTGFTLARGETKAFTAALPDTVLVPTVPEDYAFGAIFYGTENDGTITPAGDMAVESIAFEPIGKESNVYAIYLKDGDGSRLTELEDYNIYYLYYPKLTVHYLKETDNGVLRIIEGAEESKITYGGAVLTMNSATVAQNQKVEVPSDGLTINQTVGNGNFNMPPLLDDGTNQYNLVYYKIGALAQENSSTAISNITELNGFVSEDLILYMDIVDNRLSWSFTGDEDDWTGISNWPVVYAIYRERGYDLIVTKTVPIDTGYHEPFTVTVSSTAINRSSYAVEGTGSNKIDAVPASGSTPGTITFPVTDGSSVRIIGLGAGGYTIAETDNENYILTAKIGSDDQSVADNSKVTLTLTAETKLDLTNTPKPICRVGHRQFYTITDAVEWIVDNSTDFSGTIEMLVDNYLMPSSDSPVIPDYLDVTLISASGIMNITRKDSFTSGAMFTNNGSFTLKNITMDGNSVSAAGAMIDNGGTLTVDSGATLTNAVNTGSGGAVNSWGGSVTVASGAVISSCSAENGGAIYASGGTVAISGGDIRNNNATENGGAIYYAGSDSVTVSGGNIDSNSASNGGAIYMNTGTLSVSGGSITKNTADADGGAVYAANAAVSISGGSLGGENSGNSAANGGAVYADAGSVTVSGNAVISYNTATENGGAIYANTAAVTMTNGIFSNNSAENGGAVYTSAGTVTVSRGNISGNTASAYGGGIYSSTGTVTLSGGNTVLSGNTAVNGAAVFTAEGSATFDNSKIQSNTASNGGAVGIGSSAARLYFKNSVKVTDNTMSSDGSSVPSNVYLDQDTDAVINATGLSGSASVGIYVAGELTGDLFMNRGVPGAKFGTYTSTNNVEKFSNDRLPGLSVQKETTSKRLFWGKAFAVEVRYLASYANGFPPAAAGTVKYSNNNYYAPAGINATSEIAADLRGNISNMDTAVFAHAFVDGATAFDDYITDVNWNSSHKDEDNENDTYGAWEFIKSDGTPITGTKLIIYFAEPAYILIENNTEDHDLVIDQLEVLGHSVINSDSNAGYGYVFAVDGVIQDELYPVTSERTENDEYDYFTVKAGKSVKLLFPGGKSVLWNLHGGFTGTSEEIPYTLNKTEYTLSTSDFASFSLSGSTLNTNGGTYEIVFGGNKAICKIVSSVDASDGFEQKVDGTEEGTFEYTFSTLNQAVDFIRNYSLKTAAIEMLVDYLIPEDDVVDLPAGYDITFTTATDGIYYYKGTGNRATISRDQGNNASFITADGALVNGDYNTFLTVQNLIFDGKNFGGSSISGGIIKTKACNVEINSVDFRNCVARFGGGIYIESVDKNSSNKTPYGSLKVTKSNFSGCQSQDAGDKFGGGAIWTSMKNVVIESSSFTNCEAVAQAGAVFHYVGGNYNTTTTIAGCTFEGCQSKAAGSLESGAKTVTITGCAFRNSTATQRNGGAVNVYALDNANPAVSTGCSVRLEDCTFENCYCVVGSNGNGNGGALRSTAVDNEVINCSFTNATGMQGGAIAISNSNANNATFTNCRMDNCTATNQGGSIYCTAKTLTINGVNSITNCKATNEGGGIYHGRNVNGSSLSIEGLTIDNCSSTGKAGGGIYSTAQTATLTSVTVSGCTTPKEGGGLCFVLGSSSGSPCSVTITDSTISGNSASGNGGGVYYDKSTGMLVFADSTVSGNSSGGMGGGVYTLSNLTLQGTTVTGNSLSHNTADSAAGIYMPDARTLTVGKTDPTEGYDIVTVTGNTTGDGAPSDLRLPMNGDVNSNSVTVLCDLLENGDNKSEIRVVNAHKKGTQFGSSPIAYVGGFTDLDHVFIADDDTLYGIIDRADSTHKKIIWGTEPICKITDDRGRLLYLSEGEKFSPAVFDYLDGEAISAFSILRGHSTSTPKLFNADGTPYTGTTYQVKMLVENYTADNAITTPAGSDKTVILTTAGSNDSLYPYRGRTGTRSTILRGGHPNAMVTVKSNLTLQNIVLDSGSEAGAPSGTTSRILIDETANTTICLGKNATLQNARLSSGTTSNGAGVRLNQASATLIIEGGSIRNCTAVSGSGVHVKNGNLIISGGSITRCKATDRGGGVFFEAGSFTMTGGSITRCEAANGAGVFVADGKTMTMTGGSISGNTASSSGGGIAVGGKDSRLVFSGAPYVYGNTLNGAACNVQLDYGFNYNSNWQQADNPGTVIVSKGLIRGATVGVYVPDNNSLYENHGVLATPFATYDGSWAGVNYFYNDRNGLKGGLMDDVEQPTYGNYKIYWRQIYSLEITKHVLSDTPADTMKTFSFKLTFTGNAGQTLAEEFNGEYGDLIFVEGIAEFTLRDGETKIADLLPLGFHYKVEELLSPEDEANFKVYPINPEGDMNIEQRYVYSVVFNNLHAVCKITDANEGLLYYYRDGELQPAVYSQLQNAFNALSVRQFYNSNGDPVTVNTANTNVEMLVDYALEEGATFGNGIKAILTTADPNADDGFPFVGSGSTAVITRGYNDGSMITVNGDLTIGNIVLDGNGANFTANANGGLLNVPSGGKLTVGSDSVLQNSRTSGSGAGVYLAQGAMMNISGGPVFKDNVTTATLSGATNGGDPYTVPRQDIYIANYSDSDAPSLVVTGNITSEPGSIWVWADNVRHYEQSKQFAVMLGGTHSGLDAFRNARTDAETKNPLKTDPKYLYGIIRGNDGKVYWSGSMDLSVSKTVTGDFGDHSKEFSFTVSGLTGGETFDYTRYTSTNGTEWEEDTSGTLTADAAGKISFSLKHYQKIVISIPGGTEVTVSEENGVYTASYVIGSGESQTGNTAADITLDADTTVAFTNNLNAASPTGYHAEVLPYVLMLAVGLLLGAGMLLLPRRRRRGGG